MTQFIWNFIYRISLERYMDGGMSSYDRACLTQDTLKISAMFPHVSLEIIQSDRRIILQEFYQFIFIKLNLRQTNPEPIE